MPAPPSDTIAPSCPELHLMLHPIGGALLLKVLLSILIRVITHLHKFTRRLCRLLRGKQHTASSDQRRNRDLPAGPRQRDERIIRRDGALRSCRAIRHIPSN